MTALDTSRLTMRRDVLADPAAHAAYAALLLAVFDIDVVARDARAGTDHPWTPFAAFTDAGACVATVEATVLPLWCDGAPRAATAVRSVAVDPAWRGLGLFRTLMLRALAWCGEASPDPVLLYTAEPAIYGRFGFVQVEQHAFAGPMPAVAAAAPARPLDRVADLALVRRCVAARAPVSDRCAMRGAPSLFLTMLGEERDLAIAHLPASDAVVVYKEEGDALVLADVVAARMPPLPAILGALPRRRWLRTLFPPDRLGWDGAPCEDDTGLMARGPLPPAMRRPFMLPPTAGF